jgi:hypothetical protein
MRDLAKRLISCKTAGNRSAPATALAAFHVCEKLHAHMAALMGNAGFRALLAHALALAAAEVPWLRSVRMKGDGAFEGLEEHQAQVDQTELTEGGLVVLAQLLGLLVSFIGERLTFRLVGEVWPKFLHGEFAFKNGDKYHENTK